MPPDPPSLPHALHTDTYLPPNNPYNLIWVPLGQKPERNPAHVHYFYKDIIVYKKLPPQISLFFYAQTNLMRCKSQAGTRVKTKPPGAGREKQEVCTSMQALLSSSA